MCVANSDPEHLPGSRFLPGRASEYGMCVPTSALALCIQPCALAFPCNTHLNRPVSACRPTVLTHQLAACPSRSLQ